MIKSLTIKNKVWRFVSHEDVYILTNLRGREFEGEWLRIEANGRITVKGSHAKGYAWDGCSPKWNLWDLTVGTPDGRLDFNTEKPITYYASMFHDAIYQYKGQVPLSRRETDKLFKLKLKRAKFKLSRLYLIFIRLFGGIYGHWITKKYQKDIQLISCSWLEE